MAKRRWRRLTPEVRREICRLRAKGWANLAIARHVGQAESTVGLFKLEPDGKTASRVNVKLGRSSVSTIEIVNGLQPKDKVIVSDMSQWDNVAKVRLQ